MHDPYLLLPVAYRAAATVVHTPVLAEEAGERAVHKLTLAVLGGSPPLHPKAWLRAVARRSACALLRSEWARTRGVPAEDLETHPAPLRAPKPGADHVREGCESLLTPRQSDALHAALTTNTMGDAARTCGMRPRDFRRQLTAIGKKARRTLLDTLTADPLADDPETQFHLPL